MVFVETDEYEMLVDLFVRNGLEFDGDEEVDTDIVKCYKDTTEDDELLAACVLAMREGRYIIDGIACEPEVRGRGIGEMMLARVEKDILSLGGDSIYLVARAPGFFRKNGFTAIDPDDAPNFFECKYCPQYMTTCHPEVMKKELFVNAGGKE